MIKYIFCNYCLKDNQRWSNWSRAGLLPPDDKCDICIIKERK